MNKYTIYCTAEQTKKAFELVAPIEYARVIDTVEGKSIRIPEENGDFYLIPTAEEMIGWLEEQGMSFQVDENAVNWQYHIVIKNDVDSFLNNGYKSRKEATIAAIDAVLNYLIKSKK